MNLIRVNKKTLLENINVVKSAVAKRSSLPILSNILLDVITGDILRLTATDLDMSISAVMPVSVEGNPVSYAIDAKYLESVLSFFKSDDISIEYIENGVRIFTSDSEVKITDDYILTGIDFPILPKVDTRLGSVSGCCLTASLAKCLKYVSDDDGRPVLCGVHFRISPEGKLFNDATDTHRLIRVPVKSFAVDAEAIKPVHVAYKDETIPAEDVFPNNNFIIHADHLKKLKFPKVGDITFWSGKDNLSKFTYDNVTVIFRNIDGTFPPAERVLDHTDPYFIMANTAELKDIVTRLSKIIKFDGNEKLKISHDAHTGESFMSDGNEKVKVSIDNNQFLFNFPTLWEQNFVDGQWIDKITVDNERIPAEPFRIGVNIKFLAEMLSLIDNSDVTLSMSAPLSPIHVKDGDIQSVIMPMQL